MSHLPNTRTISFPAEFPDDPNLDLIPNPPIPLSSRIGIDPAEYDKDTSEVIIQKPQEVDRKRANQASTELIRYLAKRFGSTLEATEFTTGIMSAIENIPCPLNKNAAMTPYRLMRDHLQAAYPDRYPTKPAPSPNGLF